MKYAKLSVTLEQKIADEVRRTAGPGGVSAFVNEALRQKLQAARLRALLDEMEKAAGPIPDDVRQEVEALEWPE